jgi:urease accessory protein
VAEPAALQKLLTWLSPAFPVGAFAWSGGLETAIIDGTTTKAAAVKSWLEGLLTHGGLRTDAILLAHAYRAHESATQLRQLADLCLALIPARERHDETLATGDAFVLAARAWPVAVHALLPVPCPYPIAIGAIAAAHGIPLADTLIGFLTVALHSQVSVAVRLVPLGQTAGLQVMAALEPQAAATAAVAERSTLEDIGSIAYAADIAQMRHENLEPRLFRS